MLPDKSYQRLTEFPSAEYLASEVERWTDEGYYIVGWNTAFDVAWLIAMGLWDLVSRANWIDGLLILKHLTQQPTFLGHQGFGLKPAVAARYPQFAGYGDDIDFADNSPEMRRKRLAYNGLDAILTARIVADMLDDMPYRMKRNALIESRSIPLVARTLVEGIRGDEAAARALSGKLEQDAKVAEMILRFQTHNHVTGETLRSPTQLRKVLYEDWNLTSTRFTQKGVPSTDRAALMVLADKDARAAKANEYREASNNKTKFADGMLNSLAYNGDGFVRPAPRLYGTYTGRMTYSSKVGRNKDERPLGVPLHQWKRAPEYRALIPAPEGYDLCEFDFSGQEFRWMAVESNDPTMLALCQPGEDAHAFMGARISGEDYRRMCEMVAAQDKRAKSMRQLGKVGNLSCQYKTSAARLREVAKTQYQLELSDEQALEIWKAYRATYPGVPAYWSRQISFIRKHGYVQTLAGRKVYVGPSNTWKQEYRWSYELTGINFPIQGVGADQKYLALACCQPLLAKYTARFYFELHDGMFFVVPKQHTLRFAHEMKVLLSNLPYKQAWDIDLPIMFPVDAKVGPSWGELVELGNT
jgi:DNA polymerase-1